MVALGGLRRFGGDVESALGSLGEVAGCAPCGSVSSGFALGLALPDGTHGGNTKDGAVGSASRDTGSETTQMASSTGALLLGLALPAGSHGGNVETGDTARGAEADGASLDSWLEPSNMSSLPASSVPSTPLDRATGTHGGCTSGGAHTGMGGRGYVTVEIDVRAV